MLAHFHLDRHVSPHQHHRWVRDAVIAAQVGVAAIVVVTALERAAGQDQADERTATPVTTIAAAQPVRATTIPSTAFAPVTIASAPAPAAGNDAAALALEPVVEVGPQATSAVGPAAVAVEGTIQISVVHDGASSPAIDSIAGVLLGTLKVEVLDGGGTAVASIDVPVDQVGRIEGLAAGSYRLVLSQQSAVTEPSPGVAISAASARMTEAITVADGDVLLIAAQRA